MSASSQTISAPASVPQEQAAPMPGPNLEADVDHAIAVCDGDARAAVRALLVSNNYLAMELERMAASVSRGYARGNLSRKGG